MRPEPATQTFKVVFIGDTSVGKTSIVTRSTAGTFPENPNPTVGAVFATSIIPVGKERVKLEIWDTAGQERYRSLTPMYFRSAAAAIVVYDITDKTTFEGMKSWIDDLHRQAAPNILITVVGNKADLETQRQVDRSAAATYCMENEVKYFETSAKTGENVQVVFNEVATALSNMKGASQPVTGAPESGLPDGKTEEAKPCIC